MCHHLNISYSFITYYQHYAKYLFLFEAAISMLKK
jgi:hypothetical protein